ncbi:sigma 54-interacting transcriptional regulator [Sorangium sp. So ce542]|uniref:sigma 54-interacting transcriptional regulator n=1 Tax=Sorangium sp. So ce542 TaxID=3133316 RepID=UPI003F641FD1
MLRAQHLDGDWAQRPRRRLMRRQDPAEAPLSEQPFDRVTAGHDFADRDRAYCRRHRRGERPIVFLLRSHHRNNDVHDAEVPLRSQPALFGADHLLLSSFDDHRSASYRAVQTPLGSIPPEPHDSAARGDRLHSGMANVDEGTLPVDRAPGGVKLRSNKIQIEVVQGPDAGTLVELPGPEARIGSGADCDLVIKDPTVSRSHLTIRIHNQLLRVTDRESRNGTAIDGTMILDAYARPDSAIVIGGTTLRMRMLSDLVELPLSARERFGRLLGRSVAMRRLFALLERVAPTDATLLIEGETGTGKELAAEAVHRASPRAGRPFVVFDCSAVPEGAIEGELFGQVRGAYSGAALRAGRFEQADGGTLFLDDIGDLPIDVQPKLLRALETRCIRRIGDDRPPRPVDVRIIAATQRALAHEVDRGRFREDLYYRLAVVNVRMPPLRERPDDVALLVRHFEREHARAARPAVPLPDSAVQGFVNRAWPGNVRELKNEVDRALFLGGGEPSGEGGAPAPGPTVSGVSLDLPLLVGREHVADAYEKAYLDLALEEVGGNVSRAAEVAGVGRRFIQKAMRRHGLRGRV